MSWRVSLYAHITDIFPVLSRVFIKKNHASNMLKNKIIRFTGYTVKLDLYYVSSFTLVTELIEAKYVCCRKLSTGVRLRQ